MVDEWLKEADEIPFGKKSRGLRQVKKNIEAQESARRRRPYIMSKKKAAMRLYKLIYRRHALQHGAWNLGELTNLQLGKTFFGNESTQKIKHSEAEFIIRQLWKFGRSEYLDVLYLRKEPEGGSKITIAVAKKIKQKF